MPKVRETISTPHLILPTVACLSVFAGRKDRRHDRRGKGRTSLGEAAYEDFSVVDVTPASLETIEAVATGAVPIVAGEDSAAEEQYNPVVIRQKEFAAEHFTVDEAVDQMELVGHDSFSLLNAAPANRVWCIAVRGGITALSHSSTKRSRGTET